MRRLIAVFVVLAALLPLPAFAHPHIFIDATAAITFNDAGQVVAIHNNWVFDEAYSAWSIQGLDTNNDGKLTREELQPLADDNMNGLADYEYYTFAGEGNDPNLKFSHGSNPVIDYDGHRTTLSFDVALAQPYTIKKALQVSIDDPEYYVAITFKDASSIQLINAPKTCSVAMEAGHDIPDAIADELYALPPDVTKLPPDLEQALRGTQGEIVINCPGGSATGKPAAPETAAVAAPAATTALDAVNQLGAASAPEVPPKQSLTQPKFLGDMPFGSAPNEPGLVLPRTGFLGWIGQKQQEFYLALQHALAGLKTSWTGFWILGLLSFLYGVFHSAGPGHGKVVVSSYLLANEAQMRRGILLTFLASMLQSLVAIGFVLIAAAVLGMTAMAMSDAANWIGVLSYGMVMALGIWLVVRKVFGLGHKHSHDAPDEAPADDMAILARRHLGAPAHALATGGPQLTSFQAVGAGPDRFGRLPGDAHYGHNHGDDDHRDHHDHAHVVVPSRIRGDWREQLGVVLSVGLRPCSGALIVLAFALSQGLLLAGIAAVLLMGLGTALTTGALAALAVSFKRLARGLAGADNKVTNALVWWAELLAAVGVFAFGLVLMLASF